MNCPQQTRFLIQTNERSEKAPYSLHPVISLSREQPGLQHHFWKKFSTAIRFWFLSSSIPALVKYPTILCRHTIQIDCSNRPVFSPTPWQAMMYHSSQATPYFSTHFMFLTFSLSFSQFHWLMHTSCTPLTWPSVRPPDLNAKLIIKRCIQN